LSRCRSAACTRARLERLLTSEVAADFAELMSDLA
jgi:hypothetical protein